MRNMGKRCELPGSAHLSQHPRKEPEELRAGANRRVASLQENDEMETGSHLQRMSGHCALIAERLQLDPDALRAASRLHDVGMASFGPAVHERRRLNGREREELAQHPLIGHVMLSGSGIALLDTAAD